MNAAGDILSLKDAIFRSLDSRGLGAMALCNFDSTKTIVFPITPLLQEGDIIRDVDGYPLMKIIFKKNLDAEQQLLRQQGVIE